MNIGRLLLESLSPEEVQAQLFDVLSLLNTGDRLFSQGFTTREGGQGLGLHSGALAAKLLGGRLSLDSEGPGKGATATLELPLVPTQPSMRGSDL